MVRQYMSHRVTAADCMTRYHDIGRPSDVSSLSPIGYMMSIYLGLARFTSFLLASSVSRTVVPGRDGHSASVHIAAVYHGHAVRILQECQPGVTLGHELRSQDPVSTLEACSATLTRACRNQTSLRGRHLPGRAST